MKGGIVMVDEEKLEDALDLLKDLFEENFIDFRIEPFLSIFDGFFGDDMEYSKMKDEAIK